MEIVNQPINDNIGTHLLKEFSKDYSTFKFMVAYAKMSGVKYLINSLIEFKNKGSVIKGIVGIDQQNTSSQAVQVLYSLCDELYIYHSNSPVQTFHPKIYYFYSISDIFYSCGSSNLTSGGLFTNFETNIIDNINFLDVNFKTVQEQLDTIFKQYSSESVDGCCKKVTDELIIQLTEQQYLLDENELKRGITEHKFNNKTNFDLQTDTIFDSTVYTPPVNYISDDLLNQLTFYSNSNMNEFITYGQPSYETANNICKDDKEEDITPNSRLTTNGITIDIIKNIDTYISLYGSYDKYLVKFSNDSPGYYFIPQGVHLGHIFYIIKSLKEQAVLDYRIQLYSSLTSGAAGTTVRQTKYKLAACMELLLITDFRTSSTNDYSMELTNNGEVLYDILNRNVTDPTFFNFTNTNSWRMVHNKTSYYVDFIKNLNVNDKENIHKLFDNLAIFKLLSDYVKKQKNTIPDFKNHYLNYLYNDFWNDSSTQYYIKKIGIDTPTGKSLEHRIPFLISLLKSFSLI